MILLQQTPGIGFPIAASITAAILYFAPLYLEGLAENWEILLFVIGLVLIVLEVFVIPGFGIAGISGIAFSITGLTLSMVNNMVFEFDGSFIEPLMRALSIVIISMVLSLILSLYFGKQMLSSQTFGFLVLKSTQQKESGFIGVENKQKELIGRIGITATILRPSGMVEIDGELHDAKSLISYIDKGETVKVVKFEAGQLYVKINV